MVNYLSVDYSNNETEIIQDLRLKLAQVEAAFEAVLSNEVDAVLDLREGIERRRDRAVVCGLDAFVQFHAGPRRLARPREAQPPPAPGR